MKLLALQNTIKSESIIYKGVKISGPWHKDNNAYDDVTDIL